MSVLMTNADIVARCLHAIGHLRTLGHDGGADARSAINRVIQRLENPDQAHEGLSGSAAEVYD